MHNRLERYLNEVAERLGPLPIERRNEELREMQEHLLSAIEAYRELGETEQEAITSALCQFGTPQEISRAFRGREILSWRNTAKIGLLSAALLWSILGLCTLLGHTILEQPNALTMLLSSHLATVYFTMLFGLSALSGALFPRCITQGTVGATAWGTIFGYAMPIVIYAAFHAWTDADMLGVALIVLAQAACWTGAAWMGIRWRREQTRRGRKHIIALR